MELGDARLNSEEHAFLQQRMVAGGQEGRFVDIHADAMPQPMAESLTQAAIFDDLTGSGVGLRGRVFASF